MVAGSGGSVLGLLDVGLFRVCRVRSTPRVCSLGSLGTAVVYRRIEVFTNTRSSGGRMSLPCFVCPSHFRSRIGRLVRIRRFGWLLRELVGYGLRRFLVRCLGRMFAQSFLVERRRFRAWEYPTP